MFQHCISHANVPKLLRGPCQEQYFFFQGKQTGEEEEEKGAYFSNGTRLTEQNFLQSQLHYHQEKTNTFRDKETKHAASRKPPSTQRLPLGILLPRLFQRFPIRADGHRNRDSSTGERGQRCSVKEQYQHGRQEEFH